MDPHLIKIALENLLGHAWKFTSKRESASIEFGKTRCDWGLAYFVRDNGAGFDPAYAQRLFGAFQRQHAHTFVSNQSLFGASQLAFVHLQAGRELLEARLLARADHFMPGSLLDSQLQTLEPPRPDERAITLDAGLPAVPFRSEKSN